MRLMNARLCLDCEEVHDQQHCPTCSSESFAFLTRWVTPSDTVAAEPAPRVTRPQDLVGRREQVDAYRQILNPTPESPKRGRIVARGALGLALLGVARIIWRAAPGPRPEPKAGTGIPVTDGRVLTSHTSQTMAFRNPVRSTCFLVSAAAMVTLQLAAAQTKITPPKNKYTPEQDVELGREAAAEVRKQYPVITDSALAGYLERLGKRLVAVSPARAEQPRVRVLVHAREHQGDQRVRAPRGPDVREPRDVRSRRGRGRSRRGYGARAEPRTAAPWHRQRDQSPGLSARPAGRRDRRRGRRRRLGPGDLRGQPVRPRHVLSQVQPRIRKAGRPARRADHGARGLRPARPRPHVREHPEAGAQRRARSG